MVKVDVLQKHRLTTFENRKIAINYYKKCFKDSIGDEATTFANIVLMLENTNDNMVSDKINYNNDIYLFGINRFNGKYCEPYIDFRQPIKYLEYKEMKLKYGDCKRFNNGMIIINSGYRRDEPVALIEKNKGNYSEYIIAINYVIKDNDIAWGYGYYYTDPNHAKEDFKEVLAGYNLIELYNERETKEKELKIKFIGYDNWHRPVYKDKDSNFYKDINLGDGVLSLYTSSNNDFYGEPDYPIKDDIKVSIVNSLDNKNKEGTNKKKDNIER